MEEPKHFARTVPSDTTQVPIVWRYEFLKHLRSMRLIGCFAILAIIIALIFVIPPARGHPYNGTDTDVKLWVVTPQELNYTEIPPLSSVYGIGLVNRSDVEASSLSVYRDGAPYPSGGGANWTLTQVKIQNHTANIILFAQETANHTYTATYKWHEAQDVFAGRFVGFVYLLIIICATFFGADAIVSEYQARTGYLIFPNPIKRSSLFLGKFGASMTAGIVVVTLYYGVVAALSAVSVGGVDRFAWTSYGFALLFLLATMAVAYLISSLFKGTVGAIVLTFFLLFLILPIIDGVGMVAGFKAWWSLSFTQGTIVNVLSSPYPTDSVMVVGNGITLYNYVPDPTLSALVMLVYALIAAGISMFLFRRKQMTG
jgi:ABC-2 type transport system permease protein